MKLRFGPSLVPGKLVWGVPSVGVTGAEIRANTAVGQDGPGLGYAQWDGAADNDGEFRFEIVSAPTAGKLTVREDGSGYWEDLPDGTWSAEIQTHFRGQPLGQPWSLDVQVGDGGVAPITLTVAGVEQGRDAASFSILVSPPGEEPPGPITISIAGVETGNDTFRAEISVAQVALDGLEPVSVEEAALAARIDEVDELRDLIAGLIATARENAEHITGRFYKTRDYEWHGDAWPSRVLPLTGVTQAQALYWNGAAMVELASSAYVCTAAVGQPGTIFAAALGQSLPQLPPIAAGARVLLRLTVDVEPHRVPAAVKTYIKAQVGAWIKNPEALTGASIVFNPLYARLLDGERVFYR